PENLTYLHGWTAFLDAQMVNLSHGGAIVCYHGNIAIRLLACGLPHRNIAELAK
ncbi:MAG: hypothetical protein RL712_1246, partial [Bacteroidota bacterium]